MTTRFAGWPEEQAGDHLLERCAIRSIFLKPAAALALKLV